jgi:polysaccharide export outer membrane protein
VWVDDYPGSGSGSPSDYVIGIGDVVQVRVFNQEGMSAKARVRDDGKVSLPFLNDVAAAGYKPQVLAQQIQTRLKDYINTPVVTVSVEEERPLQISVVGQVTKPGQYVLDRGAGVLQAVAAAGGLTEYGHRDRVFVLRRLPGRSPERVRFNLDDLFHGDPKALAFRLDQGDAVVAE